MTSDPLAYLHAAHAAAQARAEAAGGDQWTTQEHPADTIAIYDSNRDPVVYDESAPTPEQMEHIAANSPAAALRRVVAERKILARHQDDGHGDCTACGTDAGTVETNGMAITQRGAVDFPCDTIRDLAETWGWPGDAANQG